VSAIVRDLPTGTVTLLFADIEGSTRLLQELGTAYAVVLDEYRRFLRVAVERWGGRVVDAPGDGVLAVFPRAGDAVAAAAGADEASVARRRGRPGPDGPPHRRADARWRRLRGA
jgi:class 3 adenylate cyclase